MMIPLTNIKLYIRTPKLRTYNYIDNIEPDKFAVIWTSDDGEPIKEYIEEYAELNFIECFMIIDGVKVKGIRVPRFDCIEKFDIAPSTDANAGSTMFCIPKSTNQIWSKRFDDSI